jgi:hypothetical protein
LKNLAEGFAVEKSFFSVSTLLFKKKKKKKKKKKNNREFYFFPKETF